MRVRFVRKVILANTHCAQQSTNVAVVCALLSTDSATMLNAQQLQRAAHKNVSTSRAAASSRKALMVKCEKTKVVVTGAGGRTGGLVVQQLLQQADKYEVIATVRNEQGGGKLVSAGLPQSNLRSLDLGAPPPLATLTTWLQGADALVIATSGVPQIKPLSLIPVMIAKLFKQEGVRPQFKWKEGQMPEQIDWIGQKLQIDAAKAAGVKQVILVSSMGGTDPENMLNKLGEGNILQWKRKAEQYLTASGVPYTIIHPGGLVDEPAGARQLLVGVDDTLLKRTARSIPRADVAALAIGCIGLKQAQNRSFDVIASPAGEGSPTSDWGALLGGLKGDCDYTINGQWADSELKAAVGAGAKA